LPKKRWQSSAVEQVTGMSLDKNFVESMAARLEEAERSNHQIEQFSLANPTITIEDAYAIQSAWMRLKIASGRRAIGRKIGLTSRAMQRSSNITEPDHGLLLDDMLFRDGNDLPMERFIEPRVEVELAFIIKQRLQGPHCTLFDVLNATDYVCPAVEIIDARICRVDPKTKVTRKVMDTISDNAANAGLVLGGRCIHPDELDLRWVAALLYRNGVIEESGVAAAVLNHPAHGVAWLANKIASFGEALEPGQIILSGSFIAPVAASRGDTFHVNFNQLGDISFRFA